MKSLNKKNRTILFLLLIVMLVNFSGCRLQKQFTRSTLYEKSVVKFGLKVTISKVDMDDKILQQIYDRNGTTKKELETHELILFKIQYKNLSRITKDVYSFNYKLMGFVNNENNEKSDSFYIDSDQIGFIIPPETGYYILDKMTKIEPQKTLEGYLPFWIPKNSRIFAFTIMDQAIFSDIWESFYFDY